MAHAKLLSKAFGDFKKEVTTNYQNKNEQSKRFKDDWDKDIKKRADGNEKTVYVHLT